MHADARLRSAKICAVLICEDLREKFCEILREKFREDLRKKFCENLRAKLRTMYTFDQQ